MKTHVVSAMIFVLVLGSGCGADTSSSNGHPYGSRDGGAATDALTDVGGEAGPRDNRETWARIQVMTGLADLPAFGLKLNQTVGFIRFTIHESPDGLMATEETCHIEIRRPEVPEVTTLIPEAFTASIPIAKRGVLVSDDGAIIFTQIIELHGVHLVDRQNDPLPADAEDPRIFDQDQDGKPGLTVQIGGLLEGEIQLVQRNHTRLVGQRNGDRMHGLLEWESEESILEASNDLLKIPVPVEKHRESALSYFTAVKIDEAMSCVDITAQGDALFEAP